MGQFKRLATDTHGLHWPQHLHAYEYQYESGELLCFLDYTAPDKGVGYNGGAWLVHAYAGGVDVVKLLRDNVIKEIEGLACSHLSD
jgi:hypothetical protein